MKIKFYLAVAFAAFFSLQTNAQGGFKDKINDLFTSKRYKECLAERDDYCGRTKQLASDTTNLGKELRKLNADLQKLDKKNKELNENYNQLMNSSLSKTEQLTAALKQKSSELDDKERLLKEREQKLKELQDIVNRKDSIANALNNIVKNALMGFKDDELSVELKNGKVYVSMSDKLLFKSGSAAVEDKGKSALKSLADVLNRNNDIDILIEGHTDSIPIKTAIYKDNWDLSVARATSIVRILSEENKVNPKRLTASGKSEFFNVAPNSNPEGRARNRRTEIILSPKLDELFNMLQSTN
jgi:chemotaxis protein MotB